jgi:hypothetical protein
LNSGCLGANGRSPFSAMYRGSMARQATPGNAAKRSSARSAPSARSSQAGLESCEYGKRTDKYSPPL